MGPQSTVIRNAKFKHVSFFVAYVNSKRYSHYHWKMTHNDMPHGSGYCPPPTQ